MSPESWFNQFFERGDTMPFRLRSHFLRLACLIVLAAVCISTLMRLAESRGDRALQTARQQITLPVFPNPNTACQENLQQKMYNEYGLVGCLAAEQYGTHADLVFQTFWETEEFQNVIKTQGPTKVVPVLLAALRNQNAFRLIEVEQQMRGALHAALGSVTSGVKAGKKAFDQGEKANEVLLTAIRELIQKSADIHKAARPLEPQEFAFVLLYGMHKGGGSFLDQFQIQSRDEVETIYTQHAVHLLSSLFTSGIKTAETKYRFDRENFSWARDGGNAALDVALLAGPSLGRWVLKGSGTAKATKVAQGGKIRKIAKVAGVSLGITAVGYGVTHPFTSLWAINSAGQKLAEYLGIPLPGLFGPILGWFVCLAALALLFWPIAVPLYLVYRSGGIVTRSIIWVGGLVASILLWLFPKTE